VDAHMDQTLHNLGVSAPSASPSCRSFQRSSRKWSTSSADRFVRPIQNGVPSPTAWPMDKGIGLGRAAKGKAQFRRIGMCAE
jgi:hypothetical protein